MTLRKTSTDSPGMRRMQEVLLAATEPLDMHVIAARAHLSYGTAWNYRIDLIEAGLIHIAAYRKAGAGSPVPLYAIGAAPGSPVRRPPRQWESEAERSRAYRRRTGSVRSRVLRANAQGKSMLAVLAGLLNHKAGEAHE